MKNSWSKTLKKFIWVILVFIVVLPLFPTIMHILVTWIDAYLIPLNLPDDSSSVLDNIPPWGEILVGILSAVFVVYQLSKESSVEEAQFILEYNRSFVENEKLASIEHYMEGLVTGADTGDIENLAQHRQDLINYLVYLEGFASCILQKIVPLDDIDDLFAYRFFLAMHHPEVLSVELLPCGMYYRGCYRLYDKWLTYRKRCKKYQDSVDWELPLYETALFNYYGYEKYATPHITACIPDDDQLVGNKVVTVYWHHLAKGTLSYRVSYDEKKQQYHIAVDSFRYVGIPLKKQEKEKMLRAALKELIYRLPDKLEAFCVEEPHQEDIRHMYDQLVTARQHLYQHGVHFQQLHNRLKLTDENLKKIAGLIYDTDAAISLDTFGSRRNAEAVLPILLRAGEDPLFNLENIYVCMLADEVVGLILWRKEPVCWTKKLLVEAFGKANEQESRKTRNANRTVFVYDDNKLTRVNNEYYSEYTKPFSPAGIALINVCVALKCRRMGIAQRMIQSFLQTHAPSAFELCVLSENEQAIALYKKCGFQTIKSETAYPKEAEKTRLVMRREIQ